LLNRLNVISLYKNIISCHVIILRRNYFFTRIIHIISFSFSWKYEMKIHLFVEATTNIWIEYLNIISHMSSPNTTDQTRATRMQMRQLSDLGDQASISHTKSQFLKANEEKGRKILRRDLVKVGKDFGNGRNEGKRDGDCERSLRRRKGSREICWRRQAWNSYGSFPLPSWSESLSSEARRCPRSANLIAETWRRMFRAARIKPDERATNERRSAPGTNSQVEET